MQTEFWNQRWARGQIAFHEGETNELLERYFQAELGLAPGDRVFVPLCGKTRDIAWLRSRGQRVVGIELVESAVEQLFTELGVEATISGMAGLKLYRAEGIEIFGGDIFELSRESLGPVDAVYDRAALVALPEDMRRRYAGHLINISAGAPQLLITYEYDQRQMPGPPFSIDPEMLAGYYEQYYEIRLIDRRDVSGGLKGLTAASENLWSLGRAP